MTESKTKVIHVKDATGDSHEVFIGRSFGRVTKEPGLGYFGNPVVINAMCPKCGLTHRNAGSTLECYRKLAAFRLETDPVFREEVRRLAGKTLVCFCKPGPCHGDVLASLADTLAGGA